MNRVVFTPSGLDGNFEDGTTVLDAARKLGVDIDSVCGGRGICGRCDRIRQTIGAGLPVPCRSTFDVRPSTVFFWS
jgi:uncharacterized 2Fe-2S/4Fe-4S cluster protein (DUF4445 family)